MTDTTYYIAEWNEVLQEVRKINPNAYGLLAGCKSYKVDGQTVQINFASTILADHMTRQANSNALKTALLDLTGINFEIETFDADGNPGYFEEPPEDIAPPPINQTIQEEEVPNERRRFYEEYIKSERWQLVRKQILAFWDNRCALCYSEKRVHVHHRTYERLGFEIMTDLLPLCEGCHQKFHDKLDNIDTAYYGS